MSEKIIQKFKNKNSEKPRKLDLCARNFYKKRPPVTIWRLD